MSVEQLYKDFGTLADAKDKAGENFISMLVCPNWHCVEFQQFLFSAVFTHTAEFLRILEGVKGGANEKRLASQFITRFYRYFPGLADKAIDAQFDLCEDPDANIRKQAIKDLPALCESSAVNVKRVADVLAQLFQTEDNGEIALINKSLLAIFKINARAALSGLFNQITTSDDIIRERTIKWMANKMKSLPDSIWTKEVEDYLIAQTKKVLEDVTGDEFVLFMKVLSSLKHTGTVQGRTQLVEIVADQADLDKPFEPTNPDCVDRLMQCTRQALPLFSKNVHSDKFLVYMLSEVFPNYEAILSVTDTTNSQLEMLKIVSELSTHSGELAGDLEKSLPALFDLLLRHMPLPPESPSEETTVTDSAETLDSGAEKKPKVDSETLQFSQVECLLYMFHTLAKKCPQFLDSENSADRLQDLRKRLQYFAHGTQLHMRSLRQALQGKTGEQLKADENRVKVIALKTTTTINSLIKDLMHKPPSYKTAVTLSWKPLLTKTSPAVAEAGGKRTGTETADQPRAPKSPRTAKEIYAPPSGRYSSKAGQFPTSRGRGRGYWRRW